MLPYFKQYELGNLRNFVYLLVDPDSRQAALLDCQRDLMPVLEHLRERELTLAMVLLTHTHHDHVAGLPELLAAHPALRLHGHEADAGRLGATERARFEAVRNDQTLRLGATEVRVMHTPGHSPGECCYFVPTIPALFTGDTLFIRDCGRTDFEGGSNAEMFASLQRIKALPPATQILPGHHYAPEGVSTLERELRDSPPLRVGSVEELAALP